MGTIDSPLSRIQAAQARRNQEAKCPRCGSSWFSAITSHKYPSAAYGSAELGTQEYMPQAIRVCLCGCRASLPLVRAGRTPNIEIRSFLDSIDLAIAEANNDAQFAAIEETLRVVVEQVITRVEVQRIDTRIVCLEGEIDKIKARLSADEALKSEAAKQSE